MSKDQLKACLNVMRRMPPSQAEANLSGLVNLVPDLEDELLSRVDQPLVIKSDAESGRPYLLCDYNRDGDSYRSPWSNKYDPPIEDDDGGVMPSPALRGMEVEANEVFDAYREMYFGGGVSSVYFWDHGDSVAACWLIKKEIPEGGRYVQGGAWDSIHVVEVQNRPEGKSQYKLTSTVMLTMKIKRAEIGVADLSGNLTRQATKELPVTRDQTHVVNMGGLIEEMETSLREAMDSLYITKTKEIVSGMRSIVARDDSGPGGNAFVADLSKAIGAHMQKKEANMAASESKE